MESKETIEKLIKVLDEFKKLDSEMQVPTILAFLYPCLATKEKPMTIKKVAQLSGMQQSSASRNVMAHTDVNRAKKKGHETLRTYENPMYRIEKNVELTTKGEWLRDKIISILNP
jgi:hypothetical protein